MPVRIAFTACSKFNFDPEQRVWDEIAAQQPHHLLLLGDQIYMDFKGDDDDLATGLIGYKLGEPGEDSVSLQEFTDQMRLRYRLQFGVPSFRKLVRDIGLRAGTVAMVWDDHDFGFNNALGRSGGPSDAEFSDYLMPPAKKAASRRLFEEFWRNVQALAADANATYATLHDHWQPPPDGRDGGVQCRHAFGPVEVFLLDTRNFRESPAEHGHPTGSSILGGAQWDWLRDGLQTSTKPLLIVAAGSPLSSPGLLSDQSWKQAERGTSRYQPYREYHQLLALAQQRQAQGKQLLFIGGDRHAIDVIEDHPALPEFVCAGAAAPKGWPFKPNGRHHGLLDVDDAGNPTVRLFAKGQEEETWPDAVQPLAAKAQAATMGAVEAASPLSDLFLVTNRKLDKDGDPTDEPSETLSYHWFSGTRFQGQARRLKNWEKQPDAAAFWNRVRASADRLRALRPGNVQQVCLFVPGNRESNETATEQYRALNDLAFHAQGQGCMGTCVLFDWATRMGHFEFKEIYLENIGRASAAGEQLQELLQFARTVAQQSSTPANPTRLSLVAHSLGNRVALAALQGLQADTVDRYFVNAADLPQDVFGTAEGQAALRACQAVLVHYTGRDQVLGYAASSVPQYGPRLGRTGPTTQPLPPRLHAKDVSNQVSNADPHGCLLWFPWPQTENAGGLQHSFAQALADGHW